MCIWCILIHYKLILRKITYGTQTNILAHYASMGHTNMWWAHRWWTCTSIINTRRQHWPILWYQYATESMNDSNSLRASLYNDIKMMHSRRGGDISRGDKSDSFIMLGKGSILRSSSSYTLVGCHARVVHLEAQHKFNIHFFNEIEWDL